MIERRATLLKDMKFEGGMNLKRGTPIFIWESKSGPVGVFYPDPKQHSSHCFAIGPEDYSLWVRAETGEEYLVLAEEPEPDPEEVLRIWEIVRERLQSTVAYRAEKLSEAQKELREHLDGHP